VPWPSYTDGVPDFIASPTDAAFRVGAALLGGAAIGLVGLVRRGVAHQRALAALTLLGGGALAIGVAGFVSVAHTRGFGSMIANDIVLNGFHHGVLNYLELAGGALLCVSPLAAVRGGARQ